MATDRTVVVRLKADVGQFVAGMAAAGAAVKGLTSEIDTSNDRVAWLTQGILALAPAIVPLGAAAIPVIAGLAAQMTVAAGAAGTLALGLSGIGKALKAVDAYQLAPTVENLQKMHVELDKLGPAGAEFVHFLDSIEPQLHSLQMAAREGMLPGFQDGLEQMLTQLPMARNLISGFAEALGNLARDAGKGLTGSGFTSFFDYLQRTAKPMLEDMGHTLGLFVEGIAHMLVAFEPLSVQFSHGLREMAQSFSDWSGGLEDDSTFQGFLRYIEQSIPKALDFLAALSQAFVALVTAAAPVGDVMLPLLTKLLDMISVLAQTPLGPLFLTAAAAMSIYGRAVAIAEVTTGKLGAKIVGMVKPSIMAATGIRTLAGDMAILNKESGGFALFAERVQRPIQGFIGPLTKGQAAMERARTTAVGLGKTAGLLAGFALATSGVADGMGLSNTASLALMGTIAGPWGAAIGASIGLVQDLAAANDDLVDATSNANLAMNSGDIDKMNAALASLREEIRKTDEAASVSSVGDLFKLLPGAIPLAVGGVDKFGAAWARLRGQESDAKDAAADLADAIGHGTHEVGLFSTGVLDAADSVNQFAAALENLQGWLDKRAAIRDYRDSLRQLAKGLKDGFGRKDVENIDAVGANIAKLANSIKDPELRQNFLNGALTSLQTLADKSGPKARAEIEKLTNKLTELGLAHIAPKVDADTQKAEDAFERTRRDMANIDKAKATGVVDVDDKGAQTAIRRTNLSLDAISRKDVQAHIDANAALAERVINEVTRMLNVLDGKVATTYVKTVHTTQIRPGTSVTDPHAAIGRAAGGLVRGPGGPTDDMVPILASDREYVVRAAAVDYYGLDLFNALNAKRLADGGPTGNRPKSVRDNDGFTVWLAPAMAALVDEAESLAQALRILNGALTKTQKLVDKDRKIRDDWQAMMDSLSSTVQDQLKSDIFATPQNPWAAQMSATDQLNTDTQQAEEETKLIESLAAKGLTGAALAEVIGGGITRLRAYDQMSATDLAAYAAAYDRRTKALQVAGTTAGTAAYGGDFNAATKTLQDELKELREIKQAIKTMDRENQKATNQAADKVGDHVNNAAGKGKRNRVYA